jgi:hypothetical protein
VGVTSPPAIVKSRGIRHSLTISMCDNVALTRCTDASISAHMSGSVVDAPFCSRAKTFGPSPVQPSQVVVVPRHMYPCPDHRPDRLAAPPACAAPRSSRVVAGATDGGNAFVPIWTVTRVARSSTLTKP